MPSEVRGAPRRLEGRRVGDTLVRAGDRPLRTPTSLRDREVRDYAVEPTLGVDHRGRQAPASERACECFLGDVESLLPVARDEVGGLDDALVVPVVSWRVAVFSRVSLLHCTPPGRGVGSVRFNRSPSAVDAVEMQAPTVVLRVESVMAGTPDDLVASRM